eukprot:CAMPEP_0168382238 /NCGR_PEP_ID=MMETSP0228-20121227/13290_1 /TAXON_ID=133427 /ORGANISM="Protoceratium reticulatum, Strain CCCM 535 (=CCMP 1889)" /LENGTH=101 /DNA_ID=CAMNT_0008395363 /DNA_START=6 /DNA_END=309 /DNA_ORIENTATION=+
MAKGLYKGFLANVVRSVGGALVLVFYDRAKTYLALELSGSPATVREAMPADVFCRFRHRRRSRVARLAPGCHREARPFPAAPASARTPFAAPWRRPLGRGG